LGLEPTPDDVEIDAWARQSTSLFLHGCLANTLHDESSSSF